MSQPHPSAVLELLKPVTWFPPMWAFGCGIVSSSGPVTERWWVLLLGVLLAGPMVCGTSQAVNDWFDRHVDAINEPNRPIPSGRIPGRWGLYIACIWTGCSLLVASLLGTVGFWAAVFGLLMAWAYSAPPFRLKLNGWWGNTVCAACYEGLPWFTAAAIVAAAIPDWRIILLAVLYSIGAHGIMTLNDFKSIEGDRQVGVNSLPVMLGSDRAARLACWIMALAQCGVIVALLFWSAPYHAGIVSLLLIAQLIFMRKLLTDPLKHAPLYNATGILMYVLGMLTSALAIR